MLTITMTKEERRAAELAAYLADQNGQEEVKPTMMTKEERRAAELAAYLAEN